MSIKNHRLGSDQYDADGNTINSVGVANSYDFENHLITHGGVTVVYDADGNRVSETVAGVNTNYLVDSVNPTGYAQVVDELQSGTVTRTYSYGLERINESQILNSAWTASFYGYDGHDSVRQLTNSTGAVTDTYDYDAFGNLINETGSTPNNYLFAGEQYDPTLNLYYNRARYLNTTTGRFWSMDDHEGDDEDPTTLHKYVYTGDDPTDRTDASGNDFDLGSVSVALAVSATVLAISVPQLNSYGPGGTAEPRVATDQSARGKEFLEYHEGINGKPNLKPYDKDGSKAGNCTIGWGSKIHDGPCKPGDFSAYANFTVEAAEQLLFQDVELKALSPIKQLVYVGLAQRELDALLDFTFNVGGGNAKTGKGGLASSQLLQQLNAGNYKQASNGFLGWLVPASIKGRRVDEKNLWDNGDYTSNGHPIP
jgi:RHS repeat-associated protein